MSALVGYDSSDEEENVVDREVGKNQQPVKVKDAVNEQATKEIVTDTQEQSESRANVPQRSPATPADSVPIGPSLGPAPELVDVADASASRPQSPHTAYRESIQNLTLPTVPNFSIPPSPPGSPPPGVNTKVKQFLQLKKQGLHFNEKLASSSALKNPSLLAKLITNAGLDEEQQYATSIPKDCWDPMAFPQWAFKEELEAARQATDRERQSASSGKTREKVEFVSAQAKS